MIRDIRLKLGGGMVEVELDPEHYHLAIDKALDRYRQRSSNSVEESYGFLQLQPDQYEYVMPEEVIEVRQIFRRGVGGQSSGGGTHVDPFSLAYTNIYLLNAGRQGGLAMFDLFSQYVEVMGRLFGRDINFKFNRNNHTLTLMRQIMSPEDVLIWMYNFKPDEVLLGDVYAKPWLRDYATAEAKMMLGHAYSKFATIVGPGGGTSLNGDALKAEGQTEMERLETEINNYIAGETPYSFVIG